MAAPRREAAALGVPFLGDVPLHIDIRLTSDSGRPIVMSEPDGPHALAYQRIAARVTTSLAAQKEGVARAAPRIVME